MYTKTINNRVKNQHCYISIYKDSLVHDYSKKLSCPVPIVQSSVWQSRIFSSMQLKALIKRFFNKTKEQSHRS